MGAQLDLLAWAPPRPLPPARSFLPPLVASYDLRGDAVAWLCRCWHVSFAHGSALEYAVCSPPFISRNAADVDVMLHALVDTGWLTPNAEATPTVNQSVLYLCHGGSLQGGGRKELMRQDAHVRAHGGFRELRFYGFAPVRTCEPYRAMVLGEMARESAAAGAFVREGAGR